MQKIINKLEHDLGQIYAQIDQTEHSIVVAIEDNKHREAILVQLHEDAKNFERALDLITGTKSFEPTEQDERRESQPEA